MHSAIAFFVELTLGGTLLAAVAWLLHIVFKKYLSARILCWIWLIVLLRFCLPLPNLLLLWPSHGEAELPISAVGLTSSAPGEPLETPVLQADTFPVTPPDRTWLVVLWLVGALICLIVQLIPYLRTRRHILSLARTPSQEILALFSDLYTGRRLRLLVSGGTATPMILGLWRPVLVIPEGVTPGTELRYALMHELAHHHRGDLPAKWFAALITCLHWFNPAVHLTARSFARSCELACDAAVVGKLPISERRRYGETLLRFACSEPPLGPLSAGMSHTQAILKERLVQIMHDQKRSTAILTLSAVLFVAFAVCWCILGPMSFPADAAAPVETTEAPTQTSGTNPASDEVDSSDESAAQTVAGTAEASYVWPVPSSDEIAAPYGTRVHPITGEAVTHYGLDIAADQGESVLAAATGTVTEAAFDPAYGNCVRIDHGNGLTTFYGHMDTLAVSAGDAVTAGMEIGTIGQTGWATGPHLHFGLEQDGNSTDPAALFS